MTSLRGESDVRAFWFRAENRKNGSPDGPQSRRGHQLAAGMLGTGRSNLGSGKGDQEAFLSRRQYKTTERRNF